MHNVNDYYRALNKIRVPISRKINSIILNILVEFSEVIGVKRPQGILMFSKIGHNQYIAISNKKGIIHKYYYKGNVEIITLDEVVDIIKSGIFTTLVSKKNSPDNMWIDFNFFDFYKDFDIKMLLSDRCTIEDILKHCTSVMIINKGLVTTCENNIDPNIIKSNISCGAKIIVKDCSSNLIKEILQKP